MGDGEASAFINEWDNAVARDDTRKLLKMEGDVLQHAYKKMSMFNAGGLKSLERLREDRHTSAHPAFVSTDELYEPTDEQTRSHLIAAIETVLEQRPVRGKSIIDAFGADLVSPGFPTTYEASLNYVEQKYLAHMRPATIRNFGTVLAKSAIWENVDGWVPHLQKVIFALLTIQQRRPEDWAHVEADLGRFINDDTPKFRSNALVIIGWFPSVEQRVAAAITDALKEHCRSKAELLAQPRAFFAIESPLYQADLMATFNQMEGDELATVVSVAPMPPFWARAVDAFAHARSFRQAEYLFDALISPFVSRLTAEQMTQIFTAAAGNGQIWSASGIPSRLLAVMKYTGLLPTMEAANALYQAAGQAIDPIVFDHLEASGWQKPQ